MTTIPAAEWREHLDAMVTGLQNTGALTDPRWIEAFRAVPRHVFTPHLLDPEEHDTDIADARQTWLRRVYQGDSLITAITHEPGLRTDVPTSSSTRPGLMARMLELLQLRKGMRVLEIGTGTGYNAGLLTHRLGACNVTSIDIDPTLIEGARRGLRSLNLTPHLVVGDGLAGVPTTPRSTGSSLPAPSLASLWRGSPNSLRAGPCWSTCAVRSPTEHCACSAKTPPAMTK